MRKGLGNMSNWIIRGGSVLTGTVPAQGSKNAALPILAATLLVEEPVTLLNCPALRDVENMLRILADTRLIPPTDILYDTQIHISILF